MKIILLNVLSKHLRSFLFSKSFTIFIISVLFTQVAFNMMYAGFIFRVFSLTSSSFSVSMLILIILLPQVILSFIGGIVADLKDKKKILIIGNVLRALVILPMLTSGDSLVVLYMVSLIVSVFTQFYIPAEAPFIPHLVNKKNLLVANSVFGVSLFGSTLIGYVLAGPVIQIFSHSGLFLIIALLYALAAILALFIPKSKQGIEVEEYSTKLVRKSLKSEIHSLYLLLRYTREAGSSFFLLAFSQIVILILANLVPSYAESVLGVSVEQLSLLVFAPAALGMIVSAILIAMIFRSTSRNKLMDSGVIMSGIILFCFPGISWIVDLSLIRQINSLILIDIQAATLVPLLAFLAGFANSLIFVPSQTIIQELVPENSRSKIFGLLYGLIGAVSLIPVVISGGVADVFGVRSVLLLLGCIIVAVGILKVKYKW